MKDQKLVNGEDENEITSIPPTPTCGATLGVPSLQRSLSTSGQIVHRRRTLRLKILLWNASSAALEECVEYVEELVDLVKLLVGVNEFQSGLLHRPTFREYLAEIYPLYGEAESRLDGTVEGTACAGTDRKGGRRTRRESQGETRAASTLGGEAVSLRLDDVEERILGGEGMDKVNALTRTLSAGVLLPHPLARIQSRREAERLKRKKE
ncbi:hypothetical protein EV426DRAFT_708225 [Tirmania nivea]|nr:hypothetical protein EV426DRAFT_708225 [Tirmania nivea]